MRRLMINVLIGMMAAVLLTGCQKAESAQAKEEILSGVMIRDAGETGSIQTKKAGREKEETEEDGKKESILDEAEVFEDKEEPAETESPDLSIVVGGIRLRIPGEYGCFIEESKGPIVYRDDLFTMLINVREDSYEERMEDPDTLMDGAKKIGGEITKEIEEVKIGGRPYAWFTYSRNGDHFIVIFTPGADSGKRLCAQLIIEGHDVSEEELLERFAEIAESAEVTDEPDTTGETLAEAKLLAEFGEQKTESTLKYENTEIIFQIEPDFYSQYVYTTDYRASEYFTNPVNLGTVDCYLEPLENEGGAESYIENEIKYTDNNEGIHKETVKINGHVIYYYVLSYEYEGSSFQRLVAASDVKNGYVYIVRVCYIDVEDKIELEDFENFFRFEVK